MEESLIIEWDKEKRTGVITNYDSHFDRLVSLMKGGFWKVEVLPKIDFPGYARGYREMIIEKFWHVRVYNKNYNEPDSWEFLIDGTRRLITNDLRIFFDAVKYK